MCIMLNAYIDLYYVLCSTIEYYCINMVLYKFINMYIVILILVIQIITLILYEHV